MLCVFDLGRATKQTWFKVPLMFSVRFKTQGPVSMHDLCQRAGAVESRCWVTQIFLKLPQSEQLAAEWVRAVQTVGSALWRTCERRMNVTHWAVLTVWRHTQEGKWRSWGWQGTGPSAQCWALRLQSYLLQALKEKQKSKWLVWLKKER